MNTPNYHIDQIIIAKVVIQSIEYHHQYRVLGAETDNDGNWSYIVQEAGKDRVSHVNEADIINVLESSGNWKNVGTSTVNIDFENHPETA